MHVCSMCELKKATMLRRWRWRQVTQSGDEETSWSLSVVKRDIETEKNAHNHIYDEQRSGSEGKYYLLIYTQQQQQQQNSHFTSYTVHRLCSFFIFLLLFVLSLFLACISCSWCCCFLWLSKLLVSVFSNDRICFVEILFFPFHSRIFLLVSLFNSFLLRSFACSFLLSCVHVCNFMLLFESNTFGIALSIFFVLSILRFHFVLCVFVLLNRNWKQAESIGFSDQENQENEQQEYT